MAIEPEAQPKPPETSRLTPCGEETVMDLIFKFSADEAGAPAVEYAFLLALYRRDHRCQCHGLSAPPSPTSLTFSFNVQWP